MITLHIKDESVPILESCIEEFAKAHQGIDQKNGERIYGLFVDIQKAKKRRRPEGPSRTGDAIRSWLVCLVSRCICAWLWHNEWAPLGHWAPHILGRKLGSNAKRADSLNQHNERKEPKA